MTRPLWLPLVALLGGCAVTPVPIDDQALMGLSSANQLKVAAQNEPIVGALSVYDAMARALKFNLDGQVETYQAALRSDEARLATMQMLPSIIATAGYSARSNDLATGKLDIPTGVELPPGITSSQRAFDSGDMTVGWNVLDFALAYVRARQAGDQQLIALEGRRRIVQRIIEDTRAAYWRAVTSERMLHRFARLEERAKRAVRSTRAAVASGAETHMTALSYERELTQILQAAEKIRHELILAKAQLAALINIAPGTQFKLVDAIHQPDPVVGHLGLEDLFAEAVFNRPEIRELAYRERINRDEAAVAFLANLPGVNLTASTSFNDDHFLLNGSWTSLGASVAGNLIKVFQIPAHRAAVEAEGELLRTRSLAVTATIMTQVVIGRIRQRNAHEQVATAKEYRDVQAMLVQLLAAERATGLIGEQTLVREEMNLLVAEVQYDMALGGLQSASASLMTALGYDLQGINTDPGRDIASISAEIRGAWPRRAETSDRGRYLAELEKARKEAERLRVEAEKRRREEAKRHEETLKKAAADEAQRRRAEAERLKREAEKAREDARRARRGDRSTQGKPHTPLPQQPVWQWVWPWEEQSRSGGLKDSVPRTRTPSKASGSDDKIYTGTK